MSVRTIGESSSDSEGEDENGPGGQSSPIVDASVRVQKQQRQMQRQLRKRKPTPEEEELLLELLQLVVFGRFQLLFRVHVHRATGVPAAAAGGGNVGGGSSSNLNQNTDLSDLADRVERQLNEEVPFLLLLSTMSNLP